MTFRKVKQSDHAETSVRPCGLMTSEELCESVSRPRDPSVITPDELCAQFPTLAPHQVISILIEATRSVELFGLPSDQRTVMVTKIVVEQLKQLTGESDSGSTARLDPEMHRPRSVADEDSVV